MDRKFSELLDTYLTQAGLPLRQAASQSGIPHQTIFNWRKGAQPRWYATLPEDLQRLGAALGLTMEETRQLIHLAGCSAIRSAMFVGMEARMESMYRIPKGWFVTGEAPETYTLGVDPQVTYKTKPCVTIKSGPEPSEFAGLAQQFKADAYRGKRLRFSAAVRSEDLENRAALFMRVSGANGKMLAFDNMRNRPVTGSTDWTPQAIVLDVPEAAEDILLGILLSQKGQVWMADVRVEAVSRDVPTTDLLEEIAPYFPVNLGFEE